MATIKLEADERTAIVAAVTKETFEPQFEALVEELRKAARAQIVAKYAHFFEMWRVLDNRKFMSACALGEISLYYYSRSAYSPCIPIDYCSASSTQPVRDNDFIVPASARHWQVKDRDDLQSAFDGLWVKYREARGVLFGVLNGYTTREKLAEDFPDLAKHLLPIPQFGRTLPMVSVENAREQLKALGIPKT